MAKYKVASQPSYEWGGEDEYGNPVFSAKRPGWRHGPIHDFLVEQGVTIVFHGHDHFFGKQDLDGIVYQECPQPADTDYSDGYRTSGWYKQGVFLPNSGHLKIMVDPGFVQVDYIRSFLPGDGPNGEIAYSYTID